GHRSRLRLGCGSRAVGMAHSPSYRGALKSASPATRCGTIAWNARLCFRVPSQQLGMGGIACVERSEQYRRFAQECLEMARTSEGDQTRTALIQMAQVWFRLAEARETDEADRRRDDDTKDKRPG